MSNLVIFDSQFGNTAKIAQTIAKSLTAGKALTVHEAEKEDLTKVELLVLGSPTQGGRPTVAVQEFIDGLPSLKGIQIAVFDTRFKEEDQRLALKLLMRTIGYAAPKMAKSLSAKGGNLISPPMGFIVIGKEGPLAKGELERAAEWLK